MSETPFFFEVVDLRTGEIVKLTEKEYDHFAGRASSIVPNDVALWGVAAWEPPDIYGHDKKPGEPAFEVHDLGSYMVSCDMRFTQDEAVE